MDNFPVTVEISYKDSGYLAKMNEALWYYPTFEILVEAVQPHLREEFNRAGGSC